MVNLDTTDVINSLGLDISDTTHHCKGSVFDPFITYVIRILQNKLNTRVGHPTLGQRCEIYVQYFPLNTSYIFIFNTIIICLFCCKMPF